NRDNSRDSRFFFFFPRENIIGEALIIWLPFVKTALDEKGHALGEDSYQFKYGLKEFWKNIRWDRFGKKII
ncbi:MAG: hypothetical protein KDK66_05980, partial [Deltaproteobacteria bacterium]|nr:hypothetical protein [Deltaproteobacteria bacterium]